MKQDEDMDRHNLREYRWAVCYWLAVAAVCIWLMCGCKTHRQESSDMQLSSEVHVAADNVQVEAASGFGWSRHSAKADAETVTFRADSIVTPQGTIYNPEFVRDTKAPEAASESANGMQMQRTEDSSLRAASSTEVDVSDKSDTGSVAVAEPPAMGWFGWLFIAACVFAAAFAIRRIIKYRNDFHG